MCYDRYPPFMERQSGRAAAQRVWEETKAEFEAKVPEVKSVYELLDERQRHLLVNAFELER